MLDGVASRIQSRIIRKGERRLRVRAGYLCRQVVYEVRKVAPFWRIRVGALGEAWLLNVLSSYMMDDRFTASSYNAM